MEKEFNLSEKIMYRGGILYPAELFKLKDIKEFIKIIETEATKPGLTMGQRIEIIKKRAGESLYEG